MQPLVPRTTPALTGGVMGIDVRRGTPHRLTPVATHRRTPPPACGSVGFKVSAPVGAWYHVSSGMLPDETHPQPRRTARLNTSAPPEGGGAILYVATGVKAADGCKADWTNRAAVCPEGVRAREARPNQPVGCPRMPTNPHNPACRGGS